MLIGTRRSPSQPVLAVLLATVLAVLTLPAGGSAHAAAPGPGDSDLGARSLYEGSWSVPVLGAGDLTRSGPVYPSSPPVTNVYRTEPRFYLDGCHVNQTSTTVIPGCVYGVPSSDVKVAMVGDSHLGRLFPALEEIALREGWALRAYTKSACAFADVPRPDYPACETYNRNLRRHLAADPPDIVLTTGRKKGLTDGYVRMWNWLESIGVEHVAALWDSPTPQGGEPAECVAAAITSGRDLTRCAMELPDAESGNPSLRAAAAQVPVADYIDLRDWVCPESELSPRCPAVLGGAQVYARSAHLPTTFTATLTDPIHQRLHEAGIATFRPSVDRLGGRNRYATAALLSRDVAPGGRVFVASGLTYPDALGAAAQAGDGGTVLLTRTGSLPEDTREALDRLRPSEIVVVGGSAAVGTAVVRELRSFSGKVRRVSGSNRYATAAELAGLSSVPGGRVYVVSGSGFPDALASAARAGQEDSPVLLVRQDKVPEATARALQRLDPERVVVVGGSGAVSDGVLNELRETTGASVDRVGGANRYETAALLAADGGPRGVLHIASGTTFADALAAAPAAAAEGGAVLLARPRQVPAPTVASVRSLRPELIVLVGGDAAVDDSVQRSLIRLVR